MPENERRRLASAVTPNRSSVPPLYQRSQRSLIVAALDALEDGDHGSAAAVLLTGLEEDGPNERPYRCAACNADFEWPGLLACHEDVSGHAAEQAA